jgi:hypothetical protein
MLAFERLAEEKIRDAIAAGEFEHLPGKGRPLVFDELIGLRPDDRMAYMVLKNSGFLPEHLEWRKELERCLNELEHFQQHCQKRLGKILERLQAQPLAQRQNAKAQERLSWLRQIISPRGEREQNSAWGRAKEAGKHGVIIPQMQALRQTYGEERCWLRNRLEELAKRAETTALQLHQALVEKEIRDHRPLVFLLDGPSVSSAEILAQFDREFPMAPEESFPAEL